MTSNNILRTKHGFPVRLQSALTLMLFLANSFYPVWAAQPAPSLSLDSPQGDGVTEADLVSKEDLAKILDQSLEASINELADEMATSISKEVADEVGKSLSDGTINDDRPEVGSVLEAQGKILLDDQPAGVGAPIKLDMVIQTAGGGATITIGSNLLLHLGDSTQFALLKSEPSAPKAKDFAIVGALNQGKIVGVKAAPDGTSPVPFTILTDKGSLTVGQGRFLLEIPTTPEESAKFVAIDGDAKIDFIDPEKFLDAGQFADDGTETTSSLRQFRERMSFDASFVRDLSTDTITTHSAHWWSKVTHAIKAVVHVVTTPTRIVHSVEKAVAKEVYTIVKQQVVSAVSEVKNAFDPPTLKKLAGLALDTAEVTYGLSPEGLATDVAEKVGEKVVEKVGAKVAEKIGEKAGAKVAEKIGTKVGEKAGKKLAAKVETKSVKAIEKKVAASGGKAVAKKAAEKRLASSEEKQEGKKEEKKEEEKLGKNEGEKKEKKSLGKKLVDKEVDYIKGNIEDQGIDAVYEKTGISNGLSTLDADIYSPNSGSSASNGNPSGVNDPIASAQFARTPPSNLFVNSRYPQIQTKPRELAEVRAIEVSRVSPKTAAPMVNKRFLTEVEVREMNQRYFHASATERRFVSKTARRPGGFLPALPRSGIPNPDPLQHPMPKTTVQFNY
jgi:hypothetical protein